MPVDDSGPEDDGLRELLPHSELSVVLALEEPRTVLQYEWLPTQQFKSMSERLEIEPSNGRSLTMHKLLSVETQLIRLSVQDKRLPFS